MRDLKIRGGVQQRKRVRGAACGQAECVSGGIRTENDSSTGSHP